MSRWVNPETADFQRCHVNGVDAIRIGSGGHFSEMADGTQWVFAVDNDPEADGYYAGSNDDFNALQAWLKSQGYTVAYTPFEVRYHRAGVSRNRVRHDDLREIIEAVGNAERELMSDLRRLEEKLEVSLVDNGPGGGDVLCDE